MHDATTNYAVKSELADGNREPFPSKPRATPPAVAHLVLVRSMSGKPPSSQQIDLTPEEHESVKDDLAMAKQLGWIPPKPIYIVRMLLAVRRERRRKD